MDPQRFDRFTKSLGYRFSRRSAFSASVGLGGLALAWAPGPPAAAQDATPTFPTDPHPSADTPTTQAEYLFVQPFDAGTWESKPGQEGTFILTLTGAAAQTTYFSDRPERITGLAPTPQFLEGLGFTAENPPNAAIVAQTEHGVQDVLVVELSNPVYDAAAATLVYETRVLADYGGRGLAHLAQQQTDDELAATFGQGSLFIDDCPNSTDNCWNTYDNDCVNEGTVVGGNCWSWSSWTCSPCGSYSGTCNASVSGCAGSCQDDIALCGWYGCCPGCCANNSNESCANC
jgi:hypothetical protein